MIGQESHVRVQYQNLIQFFVSPNLSSEKQISYFLKFKKSIFEELNFDCLCTEMAEFYIELNRIHPFREGNGRAQRLLFEHLAIHCGYNLSFETISKEQWIEANIIGCLNCDYSPMTDIFICSLSPIE